MSNIKLKNHNWDTTGVYDSTLGKTQKQVNADLTANKVDTSDYAPETKTSEMTQSVGKDSSGKLWTTPVSSASIVSATEAWLSSNITQETGYVIDDSLSTKGSAADASATGNVKYATSELGIEKIQFKSGRIGNSYSSVYINDVQSAPDWVYCVVPCKFGDKFIITGTAASTYRLYSFVTDQASSNSLFNAAANLSVTDYVAIAPFNSKYIVINARNTAAYSCIKYSFEYQKLKSDVSIHNEYFETEKLLLSNRFRYRTLDDIGTEVSLKPTESESCDCGVYDCSEGDLFDFTGTGGDAGRLYAFLDSSNRIIMKSEPNLVANHVLVAAPKDTAKIVICVLNTSEYSIYKGRSIIDVLQGKIDNIIASDKNDMVWVGNWIKPEAVSFNRIRNKLYWAYTSKSGAKGIAEYDFDTAQVKKHNLLKTDSADTHNDLAIHIFDDGTILCAYATGHDLTNFLHIRKSIVPECIDYFSDDIILPSNKKLTYSQLIYSNSTLYLFYRKQSLIWSYRYSVDNGDSWSDEIDLIESDVQYYCMFQYTTTENVIRIAMYSNPGLGSDTIDTNIRQAFFHTDTNTLFDSDNATSLGASNINKNNISILIPNDESKNRQRLFDIAITAINKPMILYAPFATLPSNIYRLYDAGVVKDIVEGGVPLLSLTPYFLSAKFIGTDKIVAFHGSGVDGGTDIGTIYSYQNNTITKLKDIWTEVRGSIPIRNFYPIVDTNGKAVLWARGYHDSKEYTNFNTDAKIYLIEEDKVV